MSDFGPHQPSELPSVIRDYLAAARAHDHEAALTHFAESALVIDDGTHYDGLDSVRDWFSGQASEWEFTSEVVGQSKLTESAWALKVHTVGNFPGGVVDLRYDIVLLGNQIVKLTIAPLA